MKTRFFFLLAVFLFISGCAQNIGSDNYPVESVGKINQTVPGVVVSVRPVSVAGTHNVGRTVGAATGAVAGSAIGGGTRANILGAIGGGVVGGIAGGAVEEGITSQTAMEYVIQTQSGLVTLTQGPEPAFARGDKVLILYGSRARIIADER